MRAKPKEDNMPILSYTLNSGITQTIPLSPDQIESWIESFKKRTIFVTHSGETTYGLSTSEIASFRVHNKASAMVSPVSSKIKEPVVNTPTDEPEYEFPAELEEAYNDRLSSIKEAKDDKENEELEEVTEDVIEYSSSMLFVLECSCGVKEVTHLNLYTSKLMCGRCNKNVYRDVERARVQTPQGLAFLMTNKGWVNTFKTKQYIEELRETIGNSYK